MSEATTSDPHAPVSSEPPGSDQTLQEGPSEPPSSGDAAGVDTTTDDVAVASFGSARESILGTDDRVQIQATSSYPWRVHASLLITAADGSTWVGTGWFISPRTLVTAGHCVYITHRTAASTALTTRDTLIPSLATQCQVERSAATTRLPFRSTNRPRASVAGTPLWAAPRPPRSR